MKLLTAFLFALATAARASVPPPSETLAVVTVSGHTSTAVSIKTYKVGQQIPKTYAGDKIHNYPGFEFYVSQHYALQSNMGDAYCTRLLQEAELAYPHWVDLVGAEPPDPETRMYMVYASSADLMKKVITSDLGLPPPAEFGGGITLYNNHSAYNYPSGTLQYHQRALAIHENLHMLQMVVYGTGGLEDFTYSGEQNVYDLAKNQLTVEVFDKACINNWTDVGLAEFQKEKPSFAEMLAKGWNSGSGPGVTLTQFYWTDPDRYLKWQIWRDEFYLGRMSAVTVAAATANIFGPLSDLDKPWSDWLQTRHNSFHYMDWGWEQDGNTLWSYGFPQHSAYSQTDLRYKPSEKAVYDPYRMDYPTDPPSPLVGPVKRGVEEPSVGVTVNFSRNHDNGIAGMGLGVIGSTYYAAMIQSEATLAVFSEGITDESLTLPRKEFSLPDDVIASAKANGDLFGLTLSIQSASLEVTVRTGAEGAIKQVVFNVPINSDQRERMMNQYMAVLAKSNSHGITPYIDDARKPSPDLEKRAAANFWRYEGMDRLESLYKAAWRLGAKAPQSLLTLKAEMLQAVDSDPATQAKSVADYEAGIVAVFQDVQKCDADASTKALAEIDLTGVFVFTKPSKTADRKFLSMSLINRLKEPVECTAVFSADATSAPVPAPLNLTRYRPNSLAAGYPSTASSGGVTFKFKWRGIEFTAQESVPFS